MTDLRHGSCVTEIRGDTMLVEDASSFRYGDIVRLRTHAASPARRGQARIIEINGRMLHLDEQVFIAIPAAAINDAACIDMDGRRCAVGLNGWHIGPAGATPVPGGYVDDHDALVAYLLSAVRRKDWHAVSDAANDLRVLEASRR